MQRALERSLARRPARPLATLVAIALAATAGPAASAALFFQRVETRTGSEATCFRFASDVARNQGFRNVHKNRLEVAGEKDGTYVAITCIGRGNGQRAMAVVMVAGDAADVTRRVAEETGRKMKGITCIDDC